MPNSRQIEAFNAVATELNFRRAADRLAIDQSALSRRIRQLETTVGFTLVRRTTREVSLTAAGQIFYDRTRSLAAELDQAVHAARRAAEGKQGSLRIGYMSFAETDIMPRVVRQFAERYPDIELQLTYMRTQGQKVELARNNLDAGFMLGPFEHPKFDVRMLRREMPVAIIPVDHPLVARESVTLAEISDCPMVLGNRSEWESYRNFLDDWFSSAGHTIRTCYEPSNALGIIGLVSHGVGVSIYPESIKHSHPEHVVVRPITDCSVSISTLLVWNRSFRSAALMNFVAVVEALYGDIT